MKRQINSSCLPPSSPEQTHMYSGEAAMHTLLSLNSAPARELLASTNLDRKLITQTLSASAEE